MQVKHSDDSIKDTLYQCNVNGCGGAIQKVYFGDSPLYAQCSLCGYKWNDSNWLRAVYLLRAGSSQSSVKESGDAR